jgi:hypothetical protein
MPIARPPHIRAISKLLGKARTFEWHNNAIEATAAKNWSAAFANLQTQPPANLDAVQSRLFAELMTVGIATVPAKDFLGSDFEMLLNVERDYQDWVEKAPVQATNAKSYEQKKWGGPNVLRNPADADMQLALHPKFRALAAAYFQQQPQLFYSDYWHTVVTGQSKRVASQNWHRDLEDKRLLKVFIYFNDITAENGAFQYVKASALPLKYGQKFPHKLSHSIYGDELNAHVESELSAQIFTGVAEKYTIIFADTTGFHRGGFAHQGERKLFHFFYTSAKTPHVFGTVVASDARLSAEVSPFVKMA